MNKSLILCSTILFSLILVKGSSQTKKDLLLHQWNTNKYETIDDELKEQIDLSLAVWYEDVLAADSLMDITLSHPKIMDYPDRYVTAIWIKNNRTPQTEAKLRRYERIDSIACALDVSPYVKVDVKHFWARKLYVMRYYERSVHIYEDAYALAKEHDLAKLDLITRLLAQSRKEHEIEQKARILMLKKDQKIKLYNEKIRGYKISGFLGLLLLGLGLFTVYQLKRRNAQIANQNNVISKSLSEKDMLLREIHHRVKNNLQLVSSLLTLQGRSINDHAALEAINEGKSRVRSMALIHQDLYNKENLKEINVKNYIEKLLTELFSTYNIDSEKIKLKMNIQNLEIDVDTLVPLGLIMNELITNSLKYAFPATNEGYLYVSLTQKENQLHLVVEDNGVGYDPFAIDRNSFGSTLINTLTEQLEGEMNIYNENGTRVEISIVN